MTKPITFKQAFVIVICLHFVGFVGLTQWTNYRKQARLERQSKMKELTADASKAEDWPKIEEKQKFLSIEEIKKNVEPVVSSVTKTVSSVVEQTKKQINSSSNIIQIPKETQQTIQKLQTYSSEFTAKADSTPKIKITSPNIVPKQIQQKNKPVLSEHHDTKATEKTISKQLIAKQMTLNPELTHSIPPSVPQQTAPVRRYESRGSQPQEYRKTYNIDGVEYIETKRVISSKITL